MLLSIREKRKTGTAFMKGNLTKIKRELKRYKKSELFQLLINSAKSNIDTRNNLLFQLGIEVHKGDENYY